MRVLMFIWISMVLLFSDFFKINVMQASEHCLPDQKSVLLQIRSQLLNNSSLSFRLVRWNETVDCCQWLGVSCNDGGYIIGLDLSYEPNTGGFNVALLLKLPSLSVIKLDWIKFSAPFPDFFMDFTNLTVLSLAGCNFNGTVPQKVFQVPTLQTIDLSGNEMLEGSLPDFPENGSLQSLRLDFTKFSGNLPQSIGNLKLLSHIVLDDCNFSGAIPASFINLTKLVELSLAYNHFSGWIPPFKLFKNLSHIDLSYNRFTSEIPSSHWDGLTNLEYMDLKGNSFSGPIPNSVFFLPSLRYLNLFGNKFFGHLNELRNVASPLETFDLSENNLEGSIPSFFFQLRNLTTLLLPSNKFSGQINDLQNVTSQLRNIDLSSNNLDGPIPMFFFQLQNLTTLSLSANKFSGQIIDLQNVTSPLVFLNLSGNNLDGPLPSFFFQLQNLTTLFLTSNKFSGQINDLQNVTSQLEFLDLSNNNLEGTIPSFFLKLRNNLVSFFYLDLSHNHFTHIQEPKDYGSISYLDLHSNMLSGHIPQLPRAAWFLDLSNNNFSSIIPPDIGDQLPNIRMFSIANNRIHGSIPPSWCHAANLQVLDLSNNTLQGTIPPCLVQNNSHLTVMNLKQNHLGGEMPKKFRHNCSLETLDVSQNLLEGQLPPSLVSCTNLKVLNLGNNRISDAFPCWLNKLSSLHVLVLRSNYFHGNISCPKLGVNNSWPNLQVIDLSSNNFNGNLPADLFLELKAIMVDRNEANSKVEYLHFMLRDIGIYYQDSVSLSLKGQVYTIEKILSVFTSIDFSSNQFGGEIPDTIAELKLLYLLNISHNALIGGIPQSLENLKALEALDLSFNDLTGNIPEQFESLTFLSFLNLSHNHLVGRIPQGKQFNTFDASSFIGNKGLCGFQLNISCSDTEKQASPLPKSEEKESSHHADIYTSIALGFAVGLGGIFVPIMLSSKWRSSYNKKIDGIISKIFFQRG